MLFYHLYPHVARWLTLALISVLMLALSYVIYRLVDPAGRKFILNLGARMKRVPNRGATNVAPTIVQP